MARGNGSGVPAAASEPDSITELRKSLPPGERKVVQAVVVQFERELIDALPELRAGVNTAQASGSFSTTLQIKKGKRNRFKALLATRVRTPREAFEFDMHVDDDGQLALGFAPGDDGGDDEDGE